MVHRGKITANTHHKCIKQMKGSRNGHHLAPKGHDISVGGKERVSDPKLTVQCSTNHLLAGRTCQRDQPVNSVHILLSYLIK